VDNKFALDESDLAEIAAFEKEAAAAVKTPEEAAKRREDEAKLLAAFKKNRSKDTFTPLYQSFKPLIIRAASKNMIKSTIPASAHIAQAAQSFLSAVDSYDPKKRAFASHAFDTILQKGKRLNYKYQNIGYIPEERTSKYGNYLRTVSFLREELGREPSTIELADELKWPIKRVEMLREEDKKDLVLDEMKGGVALQHSDKAMQVLHDINYELTPEHSVVLEYAAGMNGRPMLSKPGGGADIPAIIKATKLPEHKVRNAFRAITRKFREHRGNQLAEEAEESEV
jgi:DNA-directed RNA polymerase specialized sigma subunit